MLLLSGYNQEQEPLGRLTAPRMRKLAEHWGAAFRCVEFDAPTNEAYWRKITETIRAFEEGHGSVMWLDADQAITGDMLTLALGYERPFCASRDWGHDATGHFDFSMCGYLAADGALEAFRWVESVKDQFINGPFPEQTPMRQYFSQRPDLFTMLPRKVFNAVPEEVCPGKVPDPWRPGDFAAHLTMLPIEERIDLFHKLCSDA